VGITEKHVGEGKVGRYVYNPSTFHMHTDIYSYINIYGVGGIYFAVQVNQYK
jgi:hypothetical protein